MKIEHAAMYVKDLEAAKKFFVDYLGGRANDGYEVISGPRTTGDGYYESCVLGIEGNQIELTV
ncbi:VOC family protein [Mitsuokella sp. WILCCON 0060]|uniref:VOC family protein n=1 Tax=Mitsuokella sp. WILCCON 0060 TaxID=3345341 RepID=UPI003F19307C